jgi:hypothetical protein
MNRKNKYLSRRTIEDRMGNDSQANSSVILGMIVLIVTLSVVTFSKAGNTDYGYNYRYKTYIK